MTHRGPTGLLSRQIYNNTDFNFEINLHELACVPRVENVVDPVGVDTARFSRQRFFLGDPYV